MKIVFLSDDFPPQSFGGAGFSTYELALGMKKAGHEVMVVTTCRSKDEEGKTEYDELTVYKIASNYEAKWRWYVSLYNKSVIKKLERILEEIKPDVVHVNNIHFYLSYHSIKTSKKYSKRVVWTARDVMAFNFAKLQTKNYLENFDYRTTWLDHVRQAKKRWNPFRNLVIRHYLKLADKRTAVSRALKDALEKNGIGNVEVVHTGIDLSDWSVDETKVEEFKKKYNLENKKIVFLGGRLSGAKGSQQTLDAMRIVSEEISNAVLLVAANSDSVSDQKESVVFTGWLEREEMKKALASADVVLVPSVCFDSLPRTVLEATAVGTPVIGTCYGGAKEVIEDGIYGYIVNPFETKKMAQKIIDLLKNDEKRKAFSEAGKERIRIHFNQDDKIKAYISRYT